MKIGILCAGDREVAPFIPMVEEAKVSEMAMLKFYEGKIEDVDVVTLFSGVCKVNAAVAAQIMIDRFSCDAIINAGTAGGMDPSVKLLDVVVATEAAYHDIEGHILTEFHPWLDSVFFKADEKLLELAKYAAENDSGNVRFGRMVTGEEFIQDDQREEINAAFSPLSVDMETAAVAHVCHVNRIPFLAVRTITDTADHSGVGAFEENCANASRISAEFVKNMLRELNT